MKILRLFGIFLVFSLLLGIGLAFKNSKTIMTESKQEKKSVVKHHKVLEPTTINNQQDNKNDQKKEEVSTKKNESISTKKEDNNQSKTIVDNASNYQQSTQAKSNDVINNTNNAQNQTQNNNIQVEQNKTLTAWEQIGISEYDYYNKPMYSYRTPSYATYEECVNAGPKIIEEKSLTVDEGYYYSYSCYDVYSYSNKFLGVHLELKLIKEQ